MPKTFLRWSKASGSEKRKVLMRAREIQSGERRERRMMMPLKESELRISVNLLRQFWRAH
jgi:hypothetical protein